MSERLIPIHARIEVWTLQFQGMNSCSSEMYAWFRFVLKFVFMFTSKCLHETSTIPSCSCSFAIPLCSCRIHAEVPIHVHVGLMLAPYLLENDLCSSEIRAGLSLVPGGHCMMVLFYCQDQDAWSNALLFRFLLSPRKRETIEKKNHNRGH